MKILLNLSAKNLQLILIEPFNLELNYYTSYIALNNQLFDSISQEIKKNYYQISGL